MGEFKNKEIIHRELIFQPKSIIRSYVENTLVMDDAPNTVYDPKKLIQPSAFSLFKKVIRIKSNNIKINNISFFYGDTKVEPNGIDIQLSTSLADIPSIVMASYPPSSFASKSLIIEKDLCQNAFDQFESLLFTNINNLDKIIFILRYTHNFELNEDNIIWDLSKIKIEYGMEFEIHITEMTGLQND